MSGNRIFIISPRGEILDCSMDLNKTIGQFKHIIAETEQIPNEQQQYFLNGIELSDDEPLSQYNITNKSTIRLKLRTN